MNREVPTEPPLLESQGPPPGPRSSLLAHPAGFWFIFWGEFAERCSYFGMKTVLLLYMIDRLKFEEGTASSVVSFFMAASMGLPLLGGYVADNFLGKYRTIVLFSVPYVLGHVVLGFENVPCLFLGLTLLVVGCGMVLPNTATLMGLTYDQKRPGQPQLLSDAFAIYYGAVNVGAAISMFAVPYIRTRWGYQIAFLFPAVLMAMSLVAFAAGKPFYAVEEVRRKSLSPQERRQRWTVLRRIAGLFIVIVFFWIIFDQPPTTWTLFARDHIDLQLGGDCSLDPDQLQGLNPVFVVLLLTPITGLWHALARRGIRLRPTDKMLIGFALTAATMAILAVAGFLAGEGRVALAWGIVPYILITSAEICISVVGLELAFTAAPPSMKGLVTGCWMLTMALADTINAYITPFYDARIDRLGLTLTPGVYFAAFALLMVPVTAAFVIVARRFNRAQEQIGPS
jgi:POT family proton-dependent oligopeptide transporter